MSEREYLLKRVQVCDFALNDCALYLDNNPEDAMALEYYRKYSEMRRQAAADYISRFGPLSHGDYDGGPRWKWVDGPWPWQNTEPGQNAEPCRTAQNEEA